MMSRHCCLSSEHSGAIAKRFAHDKNQVYASGIFFSNNSLQIYIYYTHTLMSFNRKDIYIQARFACLRCAAG